MDKIEALDFLTRHQPMPRDKDITLEQLNGYKGCIRYFADNPTIEAVPLFLHSFGDGTGNGNYQLVDEAMMSFPNATLAPYFAESLQDPSEHVRFWSADIAAGFPDPSLVEPLRKILARDSPDNRYAAVTALTYINDQSALAVLEEALDNEEDEEILENIEEAIKKLRAELQNN